MCSRPFRPLGFAHLCRSRPRGSVHSLLLYVDHSHCPVLAPATLAAFPSTRAIETRSLPSSLAATHRGFAFYVASPKSSIPLIAACSMSRIPFAPFTEISAELGVAADTAAATACNRWNQEALTIAAEIADDWEH